MSTKFLIVAYKHGKVCPCYGHSKGTLEKLISESQYENTDIIDIGCDDINRNRMEFRTTDQTKTIDAIASPINVYPVPANNQLFIDAGNQNISSISIFDVTGRKINAVSTDSQTNIMSVDVSLINTGIYFLSIQLDNKTEIKQIIIE